jgi:hypothetical protein
MGDIRRGFDLVVTNGIIVSSPVAWRFLLGTAHECIIRNRWDIAKDKELPATYDHRLRRTGHPVRSAIHKPQIGRLVVGWVTTSEYLLLYVFFAVFFDCLVLNGGPSCVWE